MTEDARAGKIVGWTWSLGPCSPEGSEGLAGVMEIVAEFCLPSSGTGFLSTLETLLPMLFGRSGDFGSSDWNARCFTGDGVVA